MPILFGTLAIGFAYVVAVGAYGTAPGTVNVGYSPKQPVPFTVFDNERVGGVRCHKRSEQDHGEEGECGFHVGAFHFGVGLTKPIDLTG